MKREKFGSRLGFILVSAGCAIGIGNVWKFPYMCGEYGGAAFILIYLAFLLIMGIPAMVCEFSIGRGSKRSVALAFDKLSPDGSAWHHMKYIGIFGCYLLMMFYTMVGGWMMYYCFKSLRGDFAGTSPEVITQAFSNMLVDYPTMIFWTVLICIIGSLYFRFAVWCRKSIKSHDDSTADRDGDTCCSLSIFGRCWSWSPFLSGSGF